MKNFKYFILLLLAMFFVGCAASPNSSFPETKDFYDYDLNRSPAFVKSSHRESIPILEWEKLTTERKSIVGNWKGISFDGKKVLYSFSADGKCRWTIKNKLINGNYAISEEPEFYRIKVDRFDLRTMKNVEFHGIFKLKNEEMLFYGVTVEDIANLSRLPDSFSSNSVLLKRDDNDN